MTLTEDELARLEARHNPYRRSFEYPTPPRDACNYDNFDWPCDAFRLLAALCATPVADTAGIDALVDAVLTWPSGSEGQVRQTLQALAAALRTPKPEGDR